MIGGIAIASERSDVRIQTTRANSSVVESLKLAGQSKWSKAQDKISQSRDPLAAKLYHWLVFTQAPEKVWKDTKFIGLVQFIRDNPEWPGQRQMRRTAEQIMPKDLPDRDVVVWFDDYRPETTQGIERYMDALLNSGQRQKAQKFFSGWWSKTTLLKREEQKALYWRYGGLLTLDDHKKRFDRLLFAGHYSNARAIAKLLGPGYPALAEARIALAEEKAAVDARVARVPAHLKNDVGLMYERLRWRRRNNLNDRAIELLAQAPDMNQAGNPQDWWTERHIMIRRFLEKGQHRQAYQLVKDHRQKRGFAYVQAEWLAGWLALRFEKEPTEALQRFEAMYNQVKTPISRSRMGYWAGRASEALGAKDLAAQWYRKAAEHQTAYYGQMAVSELGLENELPNARAPVVSRKQGRIYEATEFLKVTRLLHEAGMRKQTSKFLKAFLRANNTPEAYRYAADLASYLGHHHDAIQFAKEATTQGLFLTAQSYPVMEERMRDINIEWALVHGVMRQESRFDAEAQSSAGALGLMQLMPATARQVARKNKLAHRNNWLTSNPEHNIHLGSLYMQELLERYAGSYVLAIAAYNAGPGRVDRWIKDFGDPRTRDIDVIDWIETMPIYETRNYVQRVLEGVYVYRLRLRDVQKEPLHTIHIAMPRKYK